MMQLRKATMRDADLLLAWRNDPQTRAMFKSSAKVTRDEHLAWLTKRLAEPVPNLYIGEIDGVPVGTIRVDNATKLSYTVAPEHRGKGYATMMLFWALAKFGPLKAEIKRTNVASIKAAKYNRHDVVLI